MGLHRRLLAVALIAFVSTGCSQAFDRMAFRTILTFYPSERRQVTLSDGFKADYYTFTLGDRRRTDTVIIGIGGSDATSAQVFRFLLKDLPGNIRVCALQKRHVSHNSFHASKPSPAYHAKNYLSQLVKDQTEFVANVLSTEDVSARRVVILGLSEGAVVASAVAARSPHVTHLAVVGDGGMKPIDAFRIWGRRHNVDIDAMYKAVTEDPALNKFALGPYTYRYWAEMLGADPMEDLRRLDIPLFFAMGEKDDSVPIESLDLLRDAFTRLGKRNLTTRIYPDCGHDLEDSKGHSLRGQLMRDIHGWLLSTPAQPVRQPDGSRARE